MSNDYSITKCILAPEGSHTPYRSILQHWFEYIGVTGRNWTPLYTMVLTKGFRHGVLELRSFDPFLQRRFKKSGRSDFLDACLQDLVTKTLYLIKRAKGKGPFVLIKPDEDLRRDRD